MVKSIQIYGPGCVNCRRLFQVAAAVVDEIGADIKIEKVEDYNAMLAAGILRTPALGLDGKVVLQGKIPTAATLKQWLLNHPEK